MDEWKTTCKANWVPGNYNSFLLLFVLICTFLQATKCIIHELKDDTLVLCGIGLTETTVKQVALDNFLATASNSAQANATILFFPLQKALIHSAIKTFSMHVYVVVISQPDGDSHSFI